MKSLLLVLSISVAAFSSTGLARDASCDQMGGHVVFLDTMYGAGIGGLFAGLMVLASDDKDDAGKTVATGALVGATAGIGLGIYELSVRDCRYVQSQKDWHIPKFALSKDGLGLAWNYSF